jgi:NADPH-dependent 2,4-dienoyl-CoA reductase/sulfur reductase-like enzyme
MSSEENMKHFEYLIIGGGMTADAAVRGIRELDPTGSIGVIGEEADLPYSRPPLTKGMWKGRPFEKIWLGTDKLTVELRLGRVATSLDPAAKLLRDSRGEEYTYDKLLLATGGSPVRLPFGDGHIIYFRTLRDYERLRALTENGQRFLVIGAGFIGSEVAAALAMQGRQVTMVFPRSSIGDNIYPADLSNYLNDYYRKKGVELVPADEVDGLQERGSQLIIHTRGGRNYEVDGVVAGIGIRPNLDLARSAGLNVEDGIVVDNHERTSAADIYAAGDVARFPHAALGKLVRLEHEDNSLKMGRQAGRNMAGAQESYDHTPYFYSDLFDLGYEAVGELDSKLETFADWQVPFQKGVIYYLEAGRVRGVLLWNVWERRDEAAALIAKPGPFTPDDPKGRIMG